MSRYALAFVLAATSAGAQDLTYGDDRVSTTSVGPFSLKFRGGLGVQTAPVHFGAFDSATGVTGSFEFDQMFLLGRCFGCDDTPGFGFTGSFRYIGGRKSVFDVGDPRIAVDPISVYDAVDPSIELGGGLSYSAPQIEAFAVIRQGFGGHTGLVAELGGDYILAVSDALTLKVGPRLLAGDDSFMDTYFTTTRGFLGTGNFEAGAGLVSRAIALSATYDINDTWGITASARFEELLDDAAASPVSVRDKDTTLSLVVTRAFDWRF